MLKIKEKEPYIILPKQRYNLSTFEPHNVMSSDFTLFIDFNLDSTDIPNEYAIIARPGMHMGLMIKTLNTEYSLLSWDFWIDDNNTKKWNNLQFEIHSGGDNYLNDRYFVLIYHDSVKKSFKMYVKPYKMDNYYKTETKYNGNLVDYVETPYNLGCGNYSKVVPKRDRMFTATTLYKLGLIANLQYDYQHILNFIKDTENDEIELTKKLLDLVFYFNFNVKNIYKVWDLSGHCNFIQKNLYIEDENVYLTDNDFTKDYEQ
jgi:hypothetical protein